MRRIAPNKSKGSKMLDVNNSVHSYRIITLLFAFLSGVSAVSMAVAPAVLHI